MENWQKWHNLQLQIWSEACSSESETQSPQPVNLLMPSSLPAVNISTPPTQLLDDIDFVEIAEDREFITHHSGLHGEYSKSDRLDMIRHTLADLEATNSSWPIIINRACIYSFTYPDLLAQAEVSQIGVGIITAVHGIPTDPNAIIDIQFCPPKGAKPAGKGRPNTLYQNIHADICMGFNMKYVSRKGKKVENEDRNLPRTVLLAFNLELNKSNGKFSERRNFFDSRYNLTSKEIAHSVISKYYCSKTN